VAAPGALIPLKCRHRLRNRGAGTGSPRVVASRTKAGAGGGNVDNPTNTLSMGASSRANARLERRDAR